MAKNTQIKDKFDVLTEEHQFFKQNWQEVEELTRHRGVTCRTEARLVEALRMNLGITKNQEIQYLNKVNHYRLT